MVVKIPSVSKNTGRRRIKILGEEEFAPQICGF
jgi:hypothetical protein